MGGERLTALNLPAVEPLPEDLVKSYRVCEGKLGMIP